MRVWIPAAGLILAALLLFPVDALVVRLPRQDGEAVWVKQAAQGQEFTFKYRHSVELTDVEGVFQVGRGPRLLIKETRFTSVGSGLPNAYPERTRSQDGWRVVEEGLPEVEAFRFFVSPVNRARILISGSVFDLNRLQPGSLVHLSIERMGAFRFFYLAATAHFNQRTYSGSPDTAERRQE